MVAPVLVLKRTHHPGKIVVNCASLTGAGSYELQFSTLDPSFEEGWQNGLIALCCMNMVMDNLSIAQRYYFRVRGIYREGPGPWSLPANIIVV